MKKGDGLNQGVEFFYKLSLKREFQNDLVRARKQLGIPKNGYKKAETRKFWLDTYSDRMFDFLAIQLELKKKYNIPMAYWWEFTDDYIFFGNPKTSEKQKPPVAIIDWYTHRAKKLRLGNIEEYYQKSGEPYVKIFILGNADKTAVLKFINKNWKGIEEALDTQRGAKRERVRGTIFKDRTRRIHELYAKPAHELRKEAGANLKYKDSLIAKILENEKYGKISEGYIRKICGQK